MSSLKYRKSVYESDEQPSRKDKEKASDLYYQDGLVSATMLAEECAMLRRHSVDHHRSIKKLESGISECTARIEKVDHDLSGNPNDVNDTGLKGEMRNISDYVMKANGKLNLIIGVGVGISAILAVVIPVMLAYLP